MNPFSIVFSEMVYRPIFNLLIVCLEFFQGNLGIAIIVLTLIVRFALLKTSVAQNNMQQQMTDLQPKMNEIQEKYKDDPEKQAQEMMNVMKTHGTGPLKGCLVALLQMPVFLGLFFVIKGFAQMSINPAAIAHDSLYSFFQFFGNGFFQLVDGIYQFNIDTINHFFLGINLFATQNFLLAIASAAMMYVQMKLAMLNKPANVPAAGLPGGAQMPDMNKMMGFMNIFMVLMIGSFVYGMPAGIGIYMVTTSTFSLIQTSIQYKEIIKLKIRTFSKH